jgi:chloramphenicol 3-O-phosphotransferase
MSHAAESIPSGRIVLLNGTSSSGKTTLANCSSAEVFADFDLLMVGVRCPLAVLEQRESERKDRTLGQARAQFNRVHAHARYDLEIDTSLLTPAEGAQKTNSI